jgi:hypothetical protein
MADILIVGDRLPDFKDWAPATCHFSEITPAKLSSYTTIVLMPNSAEDDALCEQVFGWKRGGHVGAARLMLGTYRGRHLWSPDNDQVVERWAVHARSECLVLESEKLAFVPFCQGIPPDTIEPPRDDGYLFLGGRKWRDFDLGLAAMQRSGLPGKVISDLVPAGSYPELDVRRERVPKDEYMAVVRRARVVLVPLKRIPISHGHVEVVGAIVAGRPVVVTACASCDDYVEHGVNGLLVQDNTIGGWLAAIREANERADELACGARRLAPRYHAHRYGDYLRKMIEEPESTRVRPELEAMKPYAAREFWSELRQENYLRQLKAEHRARIDRARALLRQRLYAEAIIEVESCHAGPLRQAATQIRETALAQLQTRSP